MTAFLVLAAVAILAVLGLWVILNCFVYLALLPWLDRLDERAQSRKKRKEK